MDGNRLQELTAVGRYIMFDAYDREFRLERGRSNIMSAPSLRLRLLYSD